MHSKYANYQLSLMFLLLISFFFGVEIKGHAMNKKISFNKETDSNFSRQKPPHSPWGLKASNIGATSLKLIWQIPDNDINIKEYVIYNNNTLITSTGNVSLFYLTGLVPNTSYKFKIYARDNYGKWSDSSNEVSVTTLASNDVTPPSIPSDVKASNISDTSVQLSWKNSTDNTDIQEYVILNETNPITEYTTTNSSITINELRGLTQYKFRVYARDIAGNYSESSIPIKVKTTERTDSYAPSAPFNLRLHYLSETSISLRWGDAQDNVSIAFYQIFSDDKLIHTTADTAYTITTVPGSSHNFTVVAIDSSGNSSIPSNIVNITTCGKKDIEKPSTPVEIKASEITEISLLLNWEKASDNIAIRHYEILENNKVIDQTVENSINIQNLVAGKTYHFAIRAIDNSGNNSDTSKVLSVKTKGQSDIEPPSTPKQLKAINITANSLVLSWSASQDNRGTVSYEVYNNGKLVEKTKDTFIKISKNIQPNRFYTFTVYAIDASGNRSSKPALVRVQTYEMYDRTPPSKPEGIKVSNVTTNSLRLSWINSKDDVGIAAYAVYDQDGNFVISTENNFVDINNLSPGKTYSFEVFARDKVDNWSDASNLIIISTLKEEKNDIDTERPSAPTELKVIAIDENNFKVSWEPAEDNIGVTEYRIYNATNSIYDNGLLKVVKGDQLTTTDINYKSNGESFTIKVYAIDAVGNLSAPSNAFDVKLDTEPYDYERPSAPTGLKITDRTDTTLKLSWNPSTDNVGISKYKVSISPVWSTIETISNETEIEVNIEKFAPATEYKFRVYSVDENDNTSVNSDVVKFITSGDKETEAPSTPQNLKLEFIKDGNNVFINWDSSTDNYLLRGYEIYVNEELYKPYVDHGISSSSYAELKLKSNTQYEVYVIAVDYADNRSERSNVISFATLEGDDEEPTKPTGLKVIGSSSNSVTLTWDYPAVDEGVYTHYIFDENDQLVVVADNWFYGNERTVELPKGSSYNLRLIAVDGSGNLSEPTAPVIGTLTCYEDTERPSMPRELKGSKVVIATDTIPGTTLVNKTFIVNLEWKASTDNVGVVGYQIKVGPDGGSYLFGDTKISKTQAEFELNSGSFKINTFAVTAIDAAGNTSLPAIVSPYEQEKEDTPTNNLKEKLVSVPSNKLTIYPVPATTKLNIDIKNSKASSNPYEIINISGQKLLFGKLQKNKTSIDIDELANGIYILKLQTNNGIVTRSFIKSN